MAGRSDIAWAPRVSKGKIRRLYASDAWGMLDEDLLSDVGTRLYQRCRSIITIDEAQKGRVRCPACDRQGQETIINRPVTRNPMEAVLTCPTCGWSIVWADFVHTYKRRQLNSGGALSAFTSFIGQWDASRTPEQKMLAVDRLIHAFHYSFAARPEMPTRPAGVNLIDGKLTDVIEFMNELSHGPDGLQATIETRQQWEETLAVWREFMQFFQNEENE